MIRVDYFLERGGPAVDRRSTDYSSCLLRTLGLSDKKYSFICTTITDGGEC